MKIGIIFGTLIAMFMSFHVSRDLTPETLEINMQNKDKLKGFSWYEREILNQLKAQRYKELEMIDGARVFEPRLLSQTMGGKIFIKVESWSILVTGPKGFIRILASILDIKKIFI